MRKIKFRSNGYYRRERVNIIKAIGVLVLSAAITYYGVISVRCYNHYSALVNGQVTTINF